MLSGEVQGVGFRHACRRHAQALGVKGWVRNREDGTVEIHAEGSDDALDAFRGWCREGPPGAEVDDLRATPAEEIGAAAFSIRL